MSSIGGDNEGEPVVASRPPARWLVFAARQPVFAAAGALALLAILVAIAVLLFGERQRMAVVDLGGPLIFQPLPDVLSDLQPSQRRAHHIRLSIVVQLPEQSAKLLTAREVEIVSGLQTRLRELSHEEVAGAAGSERLRLEVLGVVNRVIAPASARTVLFTQLVVD